MAEDIDRLNRNVHAISLHQLYENLKKNDPHDPIEFDPDKTTIQNTKYSAGSRNEVKRYFLKHSIGISFLILAELSGLYLNDQKSWAVYTNNE